MKGIVLSAAGSGSGKTSIATGLMSRLSKTKKVQSYKVGPDFIDPSFHAVATGRPARNLDTFIMGAEGVRKSVGHSSKGADICIVEGVRGLFEGASGKTDESSTAEMAKILGFPVVLVVNTRSLTRSAAAIVKGFQSFDEGINIAGVILNNVSGQQHERKLLDAMEKYTDVEVIGTVYRDPSKTIGSRSLGLYSKDDKRKVVDSFGEMVSGLDLDRLMDVCERNEVHGFPTSNPFVERDSGLRIAVPRDDSFCFYYEDNMDCLRSSGFEIREYSPVGGDSLPDADLHYLGGGYPEAHGNEISSNGDFLEGLKQAASDGVPVLGESGGMLTMCQSLSVDGTSYKMAGVLDASAALTENRHGPSYVVAQATEENPFYAGSVLGHSFHYTEAYPKNPVFGFRLSRGVPLQDGGDGLVCGNSMGSFMHVNALSMRDWAGGLLDACK